MKINKPTWIINAVCPRTDEINPRSSHVVFETIGLKQYEMLELELNFPLSLTKGQEILNYIAYNIIDKDIEVGHNIINNSLFTAPISFIETTPIHYINPSDKILRVILSDPNGNFPWDEACKEIFKEQL